MSMIGGLFFDDLKLDRWKCTQNGLTHQLCSLEGHKNNMRIEF